MCSNYSFLYQSFDSSEENISVDNNKANQGATHFATTIHSENRHEQTQNQKYKSTSDRNCSSTSDIVENCANLSFLNQSVDTSVEISCESKLSLNETNINSTPEIIISNVSFSSNDSLDVHGLFSYTLDKPTSAVATNGKKKDFIEN